MLFDFYDMAGTYEQRKVANDVVNGVTVDTAAVIDSDQPYETAVKAPQYNDNSWVIVEMHDSKEQAEIGHAKWVEVFRKGAPETLEDVSTAEIAKLHAETEFEKYRIIQDGIYESDFDKFLKEQTAKYGASI